jgi:hypothetical protein
MIFSRIIDSQQIILECDPRFEPAAGDIFDTLTSLARSGTRLHDGTRVRFGWSLLTLRSELAGLRICEPHFFGNPLGEVNSTLDVTLGVLVEQLQWLRRVGEHGADAFFDQNLVFTRDAAAADDLFALRGQAQSRADSGWSVAPVPQRGARIDTSDLSAVPVYALVDGRFGLLSILTLPVGYLVRLKQDEVMDITDPDGMVRWQSENSPA